MPIYSRGARRGSTEKYMDRRNNRVSNTNNQTPPVKEGDIVEVKVEAIGEKGDGITRHKGNIIFVPNVAEGDLLKIKVLRTLPKVGFGEVVEKIEEAKPQQPVQSIDTAEFGDDSDKEESDDDYDMSMPDEK